ncbi:MAG: RluA family pseudouridine synthase [Clostridia bacterium]
MTTHKIPDGVQAISLARYLARAWPMLPGWLARDTLKKKDVRVNGVRAGGAQLVGGGDELKVYLTDRQLSGPLPILFRDERVLVVEKPAGLPVDVDQQGIGVDTVLARAKRDFPTARLCHRLDAGTGGVMMLALTQSAENDLIAAFAAHEVKKIYHAVVFGHPPARGVLTNYLLKDADGARVRVLGGPRPGAVTAQLTYAVIDQRADLALVEIALGTGRTHQIRVQLANAGYPLVGDDKYGDRAKNEAIKATNVLLWCVQMTYQGKTFSSPARWGREAQRTFT